MKSVKEVGRGLGVVLTVMVVGVLLYFRPPLTDHVVESGAQIASSSASSTEESNQKNKQANPDSNESKSTSGVSQTSDTNQIQATDQTQSQSLNGLDVSHYQGSINWSKVDSNDIDFAYLKASEGINYKDPRFTENVESLKSVDMPYGAYHFFEPADDALAQAKWFVKTISSANYLLPPVLDIEVTKNVAAADIAAGVKIWLDYVEKETGCQPIIYTYADYWDTNLGANFSGYSLWLADYADQPVTPKTHSSWVFWQFSDKGNVKGISGAVDLDTFAGSKDDLTSIYCDGGEA